MIADAHGVEIVTGAVAKTARSAEGDEATEVVHETDEKEQKWTDDE